MTTVLDTSAADRLAKLIRMLGSDHDGEVLAAVAALKRTLAENELDLHDVAAAVTSKKRSAKSLEKIW